MRFRALAAAATVVMAVGCTKDSARSSESADFAGRAAAPAAPPIAGEAAGREVAIAQRDAAAVDPAPKGPGTARAAGDSIVGSMLIRTGQASIEIDSLETGMTAVRQLAQRVGGYVANTSVQAGRSQIHSASLELKIPASRFDDALTGLRGIGTLESVNVSAQDVGEEYVDVAARMANARRLEERLVQILGTRTGKLSDVLQVERELARVREEIERYDGRLRYLRTRAAVSTLTVAVHEPFPVVGERGSTSVIAESFRQSWRNFVRFTAGFIAALGTLVPLALVLAALALAVRAGAKRLRSTRPPAPRPGIPSGEQRPVEG